MKSTLVDPPAPPCSPFAERVVAIGGRRLMKGIACNTSTPRRKNKPHSEGHSRSEWLADHGPLERLGEGAVEVGDEGFDARLQVLLRGEAGAAQQLAHEDGEPDLDLVQPGRMLGGEVKADAVAGIAQERLTTGH